MPRLDYPTTEHKYRIGDRLRYISRKMPGFIQGNIYTVAGYWQGSLSVGYLFEGFGPDTWKKQSRFELVSKGKPTERIKTKQYDIRKS